jgi:hypothetical protein
MRTPLLLTRVLAVSTAVVSFIACGGAADSTTTEPGGPPVVPPQLVGTWRDAAASGSQVCDDLGNCSIAYGGSESYSFSADGHFVFAQQLEGNIGGCKIVTSLYARGSVSLDDVKITLTSSFAHNTKTATCEDGFDKDLQLDPTTYTWRLAESDAGQPQLYLTGAGGEEAGPYDLVR